MELVKKTPAVGEMLRLSPRVIGSEPQIFASNPTGGASFHTPRSDSVAVVEPEVSFVRICSVGVDGTQVIGDVGEKDGTPKLFLGEPEALTF